MYVDYLGWSLDISLAAMILIVKLNMCAYNWTDGRLLLQNQKLSEKEYIHEYRANKSVLHTNIIEFLGYTFFYPSVLVGPCTELCLYLKYSNGILLRNAGFKKWPNSTKSCLISLRNAIFCYIGMIIATQFPILGYMETPKYLNNSFYYRFIYFWIALTSCRFKYYFSWYLAEAGCQASGMALCVNENIEKNRENGRISFGGCANAYASIVELAPHVFIITNNWNLGVNNWLKHYVYFRCSVPQSLKIVPQKTFANIVTKLMSACWHGFYGSYYLFFIGAWFTSEMDDAMRFTVEPIIEKTGNRMLIRLYQVFSWFMIYMIMNYLGAAFMLLRVDYSMRFWSSFYYYGFWLPLLIIIICQFLPKKRPERPQTENKQISTKILMNGIDRKKDL